MSGINNSYAMYSLAEIQELTCNSSAILKEQIDTCSPGEIVSIPTQLPDECLPKQANICFSSYEGMYSVMVDRPVYYFGSNNSLNELFNRMIVVFDNWQQLLNYFRNLPYEALI